MVAIVPRKTVYRPIKAESLPSELRGNFSDETVVRVSVEALTDENGFTPEQVAEIVAATREFDEERDTLKAYGDIEEFLADLHA